ncbi:MAG: hypothetical protein GY757_10030 [bacterium]|nr:hypothetical protein [bacterium]
MLNNYKQTKLHYMSNGVKKFTTCHKLFSAIQAAGYDVTSAAALFGKSKFWLSQILNGKVKYLTKNANRAKGRDATDRFIIALLNLKKNSNHNSIITQNRNGGK